MVYVMMDGCFVVCRLSSLSWQRMKSHMVLMLIFGGGMPALHRTGSSTKIQCLIHLYAFKIALFSGLVQDP